MKESNLKKYRFKFNLDYFLIIIAILVSKSLYYETYGQNLLLVVVLSFVLLSLVSKLLGKGFKISRNSLLIYLLLLFITFINPNKALSTTIVFTVLITISLLLVNMVSLKIFSSVFQKLMQFLMIASLFRYVVILLELSSPIPSFTSIIGVDYYNFIFFGILENPGTFFNLIRNNGLWYEPGAFQVMINLSFLLGLIYGNISSRDYLIYIGTIITTLSTAGIIIFTLLSLVYFKSRLNYKIAFSLILIIIPFLTISAFFETVIVDKLNLDNPSAKSRYNDATLALTIYKDYPIIGIGIGNNKLVEKYKREYDYGTGSNGILYLLYSYGIFFVIIIIPVFFPTYLILYDKKVRPLISIALILIFLTQNFAMILIFTILLFYGTKKYKLPN